MTKCQDKNFKIPGDKIVDLIGNRGACFATDKITVDGLPVGWMYREEPSDKVDNGWRFFSGTEDQDYVDNAENTCIFNTNTIANYDPTIITYLDFPIGSHLERNNEGTFTLIEDYKSDIED